MNPVTAEEVRDAMIAAGITRIDHHECSFCGSMVFYYRIDDKLYFESRCNCTRFSGTVTHPAERDWQSAADWINMQNCPSWQKKLKEQFGISECVGKRCILLDPRCKGQIVTAERMTPHGMKMQGVGIVPHDEYRLATKEECEAWDNR